MPSKMQPYQRDVPGVRFKDYWGMIIPQWALDLKFQDRSWHNDAGAFMQRTFQTNEGAIYQLQLFFADPEDHGDWLGHEYGVYLVPLDDEMAEHGEQALTLCAGMSEDTAKWVAGAFAQVMADLYTEITDV